MKIAWKLKTNDKGAMVQIAPWPNEYHREDPNQPSQEGDVISISPEGVIQTRPSDTFGPWEVCDIDGACLHYSGTGILFVLIP